MKQHVLKAAVVVLATLNLGFVDRRFVITSEPPGALVSRNGIPIGTTPCDDSFVYYGKYKFTLVRAGYATLDVIENITTPWYEIPGIDFVSENLYPCKIRDIRRLNYQLVPLLPDNPAEVLAAAEKLLQKGRQVGAQRQPRVPAPAPPGTLPPPGPMMPPGGPAGAMLPGQMLPPPVVPLAPRPQAPWPGAPAPAAPGPPNPPLVLPGGGVPNRPPLPQGPPGGGVPGNPPLPQGQPGRSLSVLV